MATIDDLTPEILKKLKRQGMSDAQIGQMYNSCRHTINRMRNKLGIVGLTTNQTGETCGTCGKKADNNKGICQQCKDKQRAMRAKYHKAKQPKCCPVCNRSAKRYKTGLCDSCYERKRRYGRTERVYHANQGRLCSRCKTNEAKFKGLCSTCYHYPYHHNGAQRPQYKWTETCLNCGRPNTTVSLTKGRCPTCHSYYHKFGKERSPEIIQKYAPHGWCDCSKPAKHLGVKLQMMTLDRGVTYTETFDLCQDCYDLEFEPVKTRNENRHNR